MTENSSLAMEVDREETVSYLILTIGAFISVIIFSAQIFVFVTFYRKRSLTLSTDYFIVSLALADTLVGVIGVPGWTLNTAWTHWPLPMVLCDAWIVCDYSFCTISVYTVLFISFERFLGIRYPLRYGLKRSKAKTKVALVVLWLTASAIFLVFILYGQHKLNDETTSLVCEANFLQNPYMVFFYVIAAIWVPYVTSLVAYIIIWTKIREQYSISDESYCSDGSSVDIGTGLSHSSVQRRWSPYHNTQGSKQRLPKHDGYEVKAVKTMALLLGALGICVLPLSFMFAISSVRPSQISGHWISAGYWLTYLNSLFNPLCYCLGNPSYRRLLLKNQCQGKHKQTSNHILNLNVQRTARGLLGKDRT